MTLTVRQLAPTAKSIAATGQSPRSREHPTSRFACDRQGGSVRGCTSTAGIPLPGCSGGEGCFNAVDATPTAGVTGGTDGHGDYAYGSSFIMATELTSHGPRTRTILTYGESASPESPHYTDQTVLFSHK
ncbi:penicillin acylase family protein [Kitasatospora sp. GP82]|uniref:penicillin acylase family protein n=1 Tax=Kitasatospora sp. GP82 TaxID=3035089 RepID=UPI00247320BC|nr:penicillin acylase family protein [Kitasatospora sp. GP82]MDH6126432.1 hypothetical protein [Kitasatospora sp. GP82]